MADCVILTIIAGATAYGLKKVYMEFTGKETCCSSICNGSCARCKEKK